MTTPDVFVPAFTTLSPAMLARALAPAARNGAYPFSAPGIRYFYFARNGMWHMVKALGLEGREILVPAYHHGVEIEAYLDAGARLRFYRVGPRMDVDLADVARRIGPATRALHLTHFAGFPGPAREMKALAEKHGLLLIEDCAHALLTLQDDRPLGRTGDVAIFCFYKGLPVPNGGALVINDPALGTVPQPLPPPASSTLSILASSMLRNLALRGRRAGRAARRLALRVGRGTLHASGIEPVRTGSEHFDRDHLGLGMSPLALRIALTQDFDRIRERQRRRYLYLAERLRDVAPPLFPFLPPGVAPFFYPLVAEDNKRTADRLNALGIEAVDFWRGPHPACDMAEFPDVARLRGSIVEIPCHQDIPMRVLAREASLVREVVGGRAG